MEFRRYDTYSSILAFTCLLILAGTVLFYIWNFGTISIMLALSVAGYGTYRLQRQSARCSLSEIWTGIRSWVREHVRHTPATGRWSRVLSTAHAVCAILLLVMAGVHGTDGALFSPFQVLPWSYFLVFGIFSMLTVATLASASTGRAKKISLFAFLCVLFSLATLVYRLGYGFDPFIHEAAQKLLAATGTISPKPWYYIGYYVLSAAIMAITGSSAALTHAWILPLLALLMVVPALTKRTPAVAALTFAALPFSLLISPTPQAIANLFLLTTVLLSTHKESCPAELPWLTALATVCIHPLAGIPALGYMLTVWAWPRLQSIFTAQEKTAWALWALALLAGVLSAVPWHAPQHGIFILDMVYLCGVALPLLLLGLSYLGMRATKTYEYMPLVAWWCMSWTGAIIFSRIFRAGGVHPLEGASYGERLIPIGWYFALPLLLIGAETLFRRIVAQDRAVRTVGIVLGGILLTANWYLSYPRHDDYDTGKFVNVTASDLRVARYIDSHAQGTYGVLANQMLSAAALKEFGFGTTLPAQPGQFIYPIPTGDQWYGYYESLVTKTPDHATLEAAQQYSGADELYIVLPRYWERYDILSEELRASTGTCAVYEETLICKYTKT